MSVELYKHNQETYNRMIEMFKESNRVGIVQPTGTGKSFIYLKWVEDNMGEKFVVLSPSNEIFNQLQEYAESSDDAELLNNVETITYQTLIRMNEEELRNIKADKIIIDEFHRTGAEIWGTALQDFLSLNLDSVILGASATPVRYLDNARDMASELFDNNLAVEMTLGEAVQRKILPTPKYIPVWYDIDGKMKEYEKSVANIKNKKARVELEKQLYSLKRSLEFSYGVEKIFKETMPHNHGKFIVFCRNVEHLEKMMGIMPRWLSEVTSKVHSYTSISYRKDKDKQLKAFKEDNSENTVKLLFTIDRFNEGVHIRGIDGVIMLRPTISPIIYLQQMGRALAANNNSPLIYDMVNNYQNVQVLISSGGTINAFEKEFKDAMIQNKDVSFFNIFTDMFEFTSVIRSFESQIYLSNDELWEANFVLLQQFIDEFRRFPKMIESYQGVKIGVWCVSQRQVAKRGELSEEQFQKLQEIGLFDTCRDAVWEKTFETLNAFVDKFGRLPKNIESFQGVNVGVWCDTQKQNAKKGKLSEEQFQKLQEIGLFDTCRDAVWEKTFETLNAFVDKFGRLPKNIESFQGVKIGSWCNKQRHIAKKGKLSEEQFQKLQEIGLFDTYRDYSAVWEKNFEVLNAFLNEFGRFPKTNESYQGVNIGFWCDSQKQNAKKGKLSEEQFQKLQEIGLLDASLDAIWEYKFEVLKQFIAEFGRFPKGKESYQGVNVGVWCDTQKQNAKKGKLSEEQFQKLQEIGLFDTYRDYSAVWEKNFEVLNAFLNEFGRFPKEKESYQGVKISNWCSNQKQVAKKGKLSEEQFQKLQEIGLLDTIHDAVWDKKFELLKQFIAEFGRFPKGKESYQGVNLGIWCVSQKMRNKEGKLSDERKLKLQEIGMNFD